MFEPAFNVEFENPWAQQNRFEFTTWLRLLRASSPQSILEIGSCFGHSLVQMARCCAPRSRVVSVDLGHGAGDLKGHDTLQVLKARIKQLRIEGYDAHLVTGDSHDGEIIRKVSAMGTFDVCFIDGDHTYEGVAADWENYGRFASITAFHDIVNPLCGVAQCWMQMLGDKRRSVVEIVGSQMGIGVVYNGVPRGGFQGSEFIGWKV